MAIDAENTYLAELTGRMQAVKNGRAARAYSQSDWEKLQAEVYQTQRRIADMQMQRPASIEDWPDGDHIDNRFWDGAE